MRRWCLERVKIAGRLSDSCLFCAAIQWCTLRKQKGAARIAGRRLPLSMMTGITPAHAPAPRPSLPVGRRPCRPASPYRPRPRVRACRRRPPASAGPERHRRIVRRRSALGALDPAFTRHPVIVVRSRHGGGLRLGRRSLPHANADGARILGCSSWITGSGLGSHRNGRLLRHRRLLDPFLLLVHGDAASQARCPRHREPAGRAHRRRSARSRHASPAGQRRSAALPALNSDRRPEPPQTATAARSARQERRLAGAAGAAVLATV